MEHRWSVGPITVAVRKHDGARRSPIARDAGSLLLTDLVRELTGAEAAVRRLCPNCGATDHGRPVVPRRDVVLSLSYAPGAVAVAAAPGDAIDGLGIDIEAGLAETEAISGVCLRDWTRLEAAMKADGRASMLDPATAVVSGDHVSFPGAPPWSSTVLPVPGPFQAAIAYRYR
ncbi:hypothetical protein [Microbacterium nymphoidis]|uniref:hypothetical protein n=1 Tax=Microbacterium nymphoidis TaxID=2898586 RepID=UPI001E2AD5E3|nr:hypothetical protein [Microbacterium nymphoidis]MCD2497252.1 hypothetical protein [Microbacterium nymphoidis]